jgi:MoaA/NifB/PqqE/SkfB family radical SAM enzyme
MEFDSPQDINFFTTYRCNSRCQNCLIWKDSKTRGGKRELSVEQLRGLFSESLFVGCPNIGLAGGEPTISSFFWKLLEILPEDKRVAITTNALKSRRLIDFLQKAPHRKRYVIQVSLDGIGEVNDRVRGIKGAYRKTLAMLESLRDLDVDRLVSFTINRLNYHQLTDCYDLANSYGAEFSARMAHTGGAYGDRRNRAIFEFRQEELASLDLSLQTIISQEISKPAHSSSRLVFLKNITNYYRGVKKDLPCLALSSAMVIDLYGEVFPNCPAMMHSLGSLHEQNLTDIWTGEKASKIRSQIAEFRCGGCWNDCQVVTNIAWNREFLEKEYGELKAALLKGKIIPDFIDFNRRDSLLLLTGWHDLEGNDDFLFRWTEQQFSILVPGGTASLGIFAAAPPPSSFDRDWTMDIILGQRTIETLKLSDPEWKEYAVSFPGPVADPIPCTFRLNKYYCPREKGNGADGRKLGLAIQKISLFR